MVKVYLATLIFSLNVIQAFPTALRAGQATRESNRQCHCGSKTTDRNRQT